MHTEVCAASYYLHSLLHFLHSGQVFHFCVYVRMFYMPMHYLLLIPDHIYVTIRLIVDIERESQLLGILLYFLIPLKYVFIFGILYQNKLFYGFDN